MITKEQFLLEHNRLSPPNLKATLALLTKFQEEKKPTLKDDGWSVEKLRIPFIAWLLAIPATENKDAEKEEERKFRNYPETKFS